MKNKLIAALCALALLSSQAVFGISTYVKRVPNGNVFSCATCHDPVSGPPDLNPFGNAFFNNGFVWNATLAAQDSDGDGFTNGQELGDPNGTGTPIPGAEVTAPGDLNSKPAVIAPAITTQPASQTVAVGTNVSFNVVATGTAPLSYQWKKDGLVLAGATNTTLTLNHVMGMEAGSYSVVVTNLAGSATSAAAVLTVQMPASMPMLLAPTCTGNTFSVQVATSKGFTYYLEYKTALSAGSWTMAAQVSGDGTIKMLSDSAAADPQRLYRVRVQ